MKTPSLTVSGLRIRMLKVLDFFNKREYNRNMIKKGKDKMELYHADPRNEIERYLLEKFPIILEAYGLSKISLYMRTEGRDGEDTDMMFFIGYKSSYKTAFLTIGTLAVQYFEEKEYQTVLNGFVHEIGHLITDQLGELANSRHTTKKEVRDSVEQTTEAIAQIARVLLSKMDPKTFKV